MRIWVFFLTLLICISQGYALEGQPTSSLGVAPSWSPDGRFIVYQSPSYDIWVMNADGTQQKALTSDIYRDEQPVWSPDGRFIAFISEHQGRQELWVMRSDGSYARQITTGDGWKHSPTWSPDGKIAFILSPRQNGEGDIWVINADGNGAKRVTSDGKSRSPVWNPKGDGIAYLSTGGGYNIWLINPETGYKRLLIGDTYWKGQLSWSPDGENIAFVSYREGNYDIWILKEGSMERITTKKSWQVGPAWSPDGTKIAYASDEGGMYDIWVAGIEVALPPVIKEMPVPVPAPVPVEEIAPRAVEVTVVDVAEERSRYEEEQKEPVLRLQEESEGDLVLRAPSPSTVDEPSSSRTEWREMLILAGMLGFSALVVEAFSRVKFRLELRFLGHYRRVSL